jgi:hypothetical protein
MLGGMFIFLRSTQLRMLVYISLGTFILAAISFGAPKKQDLFGNGRAYQVPDKSGVGLPRRIGLRDAMET